MIESNEKLPCKKVVWKITHENYINILPTKWQFVITHAIIQTEICTSVEGWVTNTHAVKILCPQRNCLPSCFNKKKVTFLYFSVFCKTFYWWVTDMLLFLERYTFFFKLILGTT